MWSTRPKHGVDVPTEPLIFLQAAQCGQFSHAAVMLTPLAQHVEHEAELVVVIGQYRHLTPATALAAVLGYTCGNDVHGARSAAPRRPVEPGQGLSTPFARCGPLDRDQE